MPFLKLYNTSKLHSFRLHNKASDKIQLAFHGVKYCLARISTRNLAEDAMGLAYYNSLSQRLDDFFNNLPAIALTANCQGNHTAQWSWIYAETELF